MSPKEETPAVSGGSRRDVVKLVAAVAALGAALGMRPADVGAQQDKNWGDKQVKVEEKGAVAAKSAVGGKVQMKIGKENVGGAVQSKIGKDGIGGAVQSKGTAAGGAVQMKIGKDGIGGAAAAKGAIIGPLDSKKAPAGGAVDIKMNKGAPVKPWTK
jgi:hypothetical protein